MFPVEDPEIKKQVMHILEVQLADNVKAHVLQPDGSYEKMDLRGKQIWVSGPVLRGGGGGREEKTGRAGAEGPAGIYPGGAAGKPVKSENTDRELPGSISGSLFCRREK